MVEEVSFPFIHAPYARCPTKLEILFLFFPFQFLLPSVIPEHESSILQQEAGFIQDMGFSYSKESKIQLCITIEVLFRG